MRRLVIPNVNFPEKRGFILLSSSTWCWKINSAQNMKRRKKNILVPGQDLFDFEESCSSWLLPFLFMLKKG